MLGLNALYGLHKHKGSQIIGPQEDTGTGPNEAGVYGLVKNFINDEGANLVLGDVVKVKGNGTIEKTETLSDPKVAGVVAGVGPYANGASVPVVISGWHPAVKVTGAAAAGAYLTSSNTDGTAEAQTPAGAGSFARATSAAAGGTAPAIVFDPNLGAAVNNFVDLGDVPHAYATHGLKGVRVNAGETALEFAALVNNFVNLADVPASYATHGLQAVRVNGGATGLEFANFPASGSIEYDPARSPASPNAVNDEFDDLSLAAGWTISSSGGGSTGTVSETDRKGFLHVRCKDGGAGSGRGAWKVWTPGAGEFTVVARVFGNVRDAGSNQMNLIIYNTVGGFMFCVGMLNGASGAIINQPGGFSAHNVPGITGNVGEMWLMIQRDTGTGIDGWISADGNIWTRLTGASVAGTVGRVSLESSAFSSSQAEGWFDFVRVFNGVRTFDVGSAP